MINIEEKKKEIEEKWAPCAEACNQLMKALDEFRAISLDECDKENKEELQSCMTLGRDIDSRTNFVLRSLLVRHGNVLFL